MSGRNCVDYINGVRERARVLGRLQVVSVSLDDSLRRGTLVIGKVVQLACERLCVCLCYSVNG